MMKKTASLKTGIDIYLKKIGNHIVGQMCCWWPVSQLKYNRHSMTKSWRVRMKLSNEF